jgi:hypothetical protein
VFADPAKQALIEIVAAQGGIAAGGQDFEYAAAEFENRDIECTAAQIVDREDAFRGVIQSIGDGRCGRLVEQAQHVQAGQLRGVFGGLALGIVEIGGNGNDCADQFIAQCIFGNLAQRRQDLGGHFYRAFDAGDRFDLHHARLILEIVGQVFSVGDVFQAAPHEALDRNNGVFRIGGLRRLRLAADIGVAIRQIAHYRWQQGVAVFILQHFGNAVADSRHQ